MLFPSLLARLARAPRWVVAPVGLGYGQDELRAWALARRRAVLTDPAAADDRPALLVPARRGDVSRLPSGWALDDVLFLSEADLTFGPRDWTTALGGASPAFARASWEAARGWPEGFRLARQLSMAAPPDLAAHPLVRAHLRRLVPDDTHDALVRAARAPLLLPALYGTLDLDAATVEDLHDRGLLIAEGGGLRLPELLRAVLRPPPDARDVSLGRALIEAGRVPEGLAALADAQCWEPFLEGLAGWFKAAMGEDALRGWLARVPPARRDHPACLYLGGLLERVKGDFGRAEAAYERALDGADEALAPVVENARGVTLALQDRREEALEAFGRATRGRGVTAGEAWHNRAGLLIEMQRYAEAEASLQEAISAFRGAADYAREARTLQLLGTFYQKRGLLPEAERTLTEALGLLARFGGAPTALVRANFAEVLCLAGELERAEAELDLAAREAGGAADARAWGWTRLNAALVRLARNDLAGAEEHLGALLLGGQQEKALAAEANLLLARLRRLAGDTVGARAALSGAGSLGLRAALETALLGDGDLGDVIARARAEEARYELAVALLHRGEEDDLREALGLIRAHRYRALLASPAYAGKLIGVLGDDGALRDLFPIDLTLLGAFRVRFLGREFGLADFPTRKSAALFVALASQERPLSREALADRFWPGAKNPVGSLQTAIYHLRGLLGAPVVRGERGQLSLAFPVRTDLARLEAESERAAALPPDEGRAVLARALDAAGPYLPEFPEDFGEERAHADGVVRRLRRRLADLSPAGSDALLGALRGLLAADPFDVETRERLIGQHEARGDAEAAHAERRRLEEVRRELG